ncbi:tetratricopeptide repeat protein [Pseudodesulfovibrio sediminis]|uniref:Cell division coordinator CpoB n=1 Tax=Pseudodesulfovibrio sediminis TaxID=2810563 RepID=A0ABM7P2R5_9BACT|nr:tetratricopeptide repeat protein [Pseudodesulfovibrio sediminis]BCS87077.1 hypothetical protein PSDVSF_03190 [Pseudodesulfovibrio sediminis]
MKKIVQKFIPVLAIITLCALAGCATRNEVEAMQGQRQQDLHRVKQLESELEESKMLLKEEIEKSNSPIRERSADMWADIQAIRSELAQIHGQLDDMSLRMDTQLGTAESGVTMDALKKQVDDLSFAIENELQVDLDKSKNERAALQPATPTTQNGAATATPAVVPAGSTTEQTAQATPPADADPAQALYNKAYTLYKEGKYEKARSYWAEFTDTFKKHSFTPSAVFWQGQCYYKLKDYARAVILFEDVIEKYQKSSKYKAALLKSGYSWGYMKKPELAKMRLQEVVKKFPKSVEATQAKRTLDKMK